MSGKSLLLAAAIALLPVTAFADDKNISDGAAKGQANELTATDHHGADGAAKGQATEGMYNPSSGSSGGCATTPAGKGISSPTGSMSYRTTDSASPKAGCRKLPGKLKSGTITN